jgi:hypothetical protein
MLAWIIEHQVPLLWGAGGSALLIVIATVAAAVVLVRIPADHFMPSGRAREKAEGKRHPTRRVVRNVIGYVILAAGLGMLLLPGPGMLVILMGVLLADFPGKAKVQRWILFRKSILKAANRLRRAFGKPPIQRPSPGENRPSRSPAPDAAVCS